MNAEPMLSERRGTCQYHPTPAKSDKAEWDHWQVSSIHDFFSLLLLSKQWTGLGGQWHVTGPTHKGRDWAGICMLRDSGDGVHVKVHAPAGAWRSGPRSCGQRWRCCTSCHAPQRSPSISTFTRRKAKHVKGYPHNYFSSWSIKVMFKFRG